MDELLVAGMEQRNIISLGRAATRNALRDEGQMFRGPAKEKALEKLSAFRRPFGFPQHTPAKIV